MKLGDERTPCASCPYRKDAPRGMWDRAEFLNVRAQDSQFGSMFGCHKFRLRPREEHTVCVGWLLDQKRRNFPSLLLRLFLMESKVTADQLDEFNDGGHKLYPSIAAMCRANGVR